MILLEDTRNKIGKHENIYQYCAQHGIQIERVCLNVGDYTLRGGNTAIDTKEDLSEVSKNLMNRKDHSRFWKEVRRAKEQGIKLIILVEHGENIKSIQDVALWRSKYSPVSGRRLMDEMIRVEMAYGVQWQFCAKKDTAQRIFEILNQKGR